MIIPTPGSIVKTNACREKIIKVNRVIITHDNLYLIKYYDSEANFKESSINCSHICDVISYGKSTPKPLNYFDGYGEDTYLTYNKTMYCGSLISIVSNCMRKLSYAIDRPIDYEKLKPLWKKTSPGYVGKIEFGFDVSYPIINKKKIQKWVSINYHKFLMNKKKWQKEIDKRNDEYAAQYWKEVDEQMDLEFDELI